MSLVEARSFHVSRHVSPSKRAETDHTVMVDSETLEIAVVPLREARGRESRTNRILFRDGVSRMFAEKRAKLLREKRGELVRSVAESDSAKREAIEARKRGR